MRNSKLLFVTGALSLAEATLAGGGIVLSLAAVPTETENAAVADAPTDRQRLVT